MPFQSEGQRRYLYANHPRVAAKFQSHTARNAKLPEHAPPKAVKRKAKR